MEKQNNTVDPVKDDYYIDNEKRPVSDSASDDAILSQFSPAEERRILRKIDTRLVLTVGFMYCISLMDRTNLSAANIAG
jgi:hypothetical protein